MIPAAWERYGCQISLPGFSLAGQRSLAEARVLVAGAGGLGCPSAQYLAAAGIGTIGIADFDTVSVSNLHRQLLYTPAEQGQHKATVACRKLQEQNPGIRMVPHLLRITSGNVMALIAAYDLVVDATDNFETRYLLNDACVLGGKPLVYGAIYQYEGQVAVWNVAGEDGARSPHYRDLFPVANAGAIRGCAEGGVIPTLAGIVGCMQANEVLKYFTRTGSLLSGKLLLLDALTMESRIISLGPASRKAVTCLQETLDVPAITVKELNEVRNTGAYVLVDVRREDERLAGDMGGLHIPLHDLERDAGLIPAAGNIVFYCASGRRSAEAVRIMLQKFPERTVFSLEGGLNAWEKGT